VSGIFGLPLWQSAVSGGHWPVWQCCQWHSAVSVFASAYSVNEKLICVLRK